MKKITLILILTCFVTGIYAQMSANANASNNDLNHEETVTANNESNQPEELQSGADVIMIRCYIRLSKKSESNIKVYKDGVKPQLIKLEPVTEDDDNNSLVVLYELLSKYIGQGYTIQSATDAGLYEAGGGFGYSPGQKFLSTYILKK